MNETDQGVESIVTPEIQKEKNKKNKTKLLIGGFLVLIAIAIGLYFGYKKLNNDPMSIYKDSINSTYKYLNDALKKADNKSLSNLDITKDPVVLDLDLKLDSNMEELKNFTGLNYNIGLGLDLANKKMNLNAGIRENNNEVISAILSIVNDNIYLKSEKLINKVLDLGSEENIFDNMDFNFEVNGNEATYSVDNYEYILKEFKTILINSLDKDKFTMDSEKITINNKEYNAKKATYNLDKENMERTIKYIRDEILKDDKLLDAISASIGITKDEIKTNLNEEIDMSDYKDSKIILYTNNLNDLIAGSVFFGEEQIIKFDCVNDEINILVTMDTDKLEINQNKDEIVTLKVIENNTEIGKLVMDIDDKNAKIDYDIKAEGQSFNGTIELNNIKNEKDKVSSDIKFTINTTVLNKPIDLSLTGSYSIAKSSVESLDTANSVKIDNLTEEETMEMITNLSEVLERLGLQDLLSM